MPENHLQPETPSQPLIPQFSIRWLLGVMTGAAGVFSIVALGIQGEAWAAAVSIAFLSLVVLGLVYAAAFGLVWVFSIVTSPYGGRFRQGGSGESPFAPPPAQTGAPANKKDVPATPIVLD